MNWITPSHIQGNLWVGTPIEGSELTVQQQTRRDRAPGSAKWRLYAHTVKFEPRPGDSMGEILAIACLIRCFTRDRARMCLVTPSGEDIWVPTPASLRGEKN